MSRFLNAYLGCDYNVSVLPNTCVSWSWPKVSKILAKLRRQWGGERFQSAVSELRVLAKIVKKWARSTSDHFCSCKKWVPVSITPSSSAAGMFPDVPASFFYRLVKPAERIHWDTETVSFRPPSPPLLRIAPSPQDTFISVWFLRWSVLLATSISCPDELWWCNKNAAVLFFFSFYCHTFPSPGESPPDPSLLNLSSVSPLLISSCKALTPFPHRDERRQELGSNSARIRAHISVRCTAWCLALRAGQ